MKIRKIIFSTFLVSSLILIANNEIDAKKNRINQIDQQVQNNQNKINSNKTNITNAQRSESDIKKEIQKIENDINVKQKEYKELESKYINLLKAIGKNETQIKNSIRDIEESNYNIISNKSYYSYFVSLWDKITKIKNIEDDRYKETNIKTEKLTHDTKIILDKQFKYIKSLEEHKYDVEKVKKNTEKIKEQNEEKASEIDKAKKEVKQKKAELDSAKAAKNKAVRELQNLQNKLKQENTKMESTNKNLIAEKKRLEAQIQEIIAQALKQKELENKKKEEAIKNDKNKSESDKQASIEALSSEIKGTGKLMAPLIGDVVVKYGEEKLEGLKSNGIEIKGKIGQEIKAADSGNVIFTGTLNGLGSVVIIDHGGIVTVYGNLASIRVAKSTKVTKGQIIGTLGREAISKEPRLYFETRKGVNIVNPLGLL